MNAMKSWVAAAAMVTLTGAAQAALIDRGGGMIFDNTRNITWLADMNYAKTSGYSSDGRMTWDQANTWAGNLVVGGFSDWRLPTLNPADASCTGGFGVGVGYNCTGGELSGLFVTNLGNKENESVLNQAGDTAEQVNNLALFSNVQSAIYWSGTEYPGSSSAWMFRGTDGRQTTSPEDNPLYAVAVRNGDVAATATAVPEPQTLALALLALGATVVARRGQSGRRRPADGLDRFGAGRRHLTGMNWRCRPFGDMG